MTRMDAMISPEFQSRRRIRRPPKLRISWLRFQPSRTLFFAGVVVPACAAGGYGLGELIRLLR